MTDTKKIIEVPMDLTFAEAKRIVSYADDGVDIGDGLRFRPSIVYPGGMSAGNGFVGGKLLSLARQRLKSKIGEEL